jgi:surfeit locus 1 family protein
VVQTGEASEGLLREWPQPVAGVEKHYGYAFQWFGLGTLITMLYVWFQIVRPNSFFKKSS